MLSEGHITIALPENFFLMIVLLILDTKLGNAELYTSVSENGTLFNDVFICSLLSSLILYFIHNLSTKELIIPADLFNLVLNKSLLTNSINSFLNFSFCSIDKSLLFFDLRNLFNLSNSFERIAFIVPSNALYALFAFPMVNPPAHNEFITCEGSVISASSAKWSGFIWIPNPLVVTRIVLNGWSDVHAPSGFTFVSPFFIVVGGLNDDT